MRIVVSESESGGGAAAPEAPSQPGWAKRVWLAIWRRVAAPVPESGRAPDLQAAGASSKSEARARRRSHPSPPIRALVDYEDIYLA